jgi:hypothetical protein
MAHPHPPPLAQAAQVRQHKSTPPLLNLTLNPGAMSLLVMTWQPNIEHTMSSFIIMGLTQPQDYVIATMQQHGTGQGHGDDSQCYSTSIDRYKWYSTRCLIV